jgi:hypothetical protein
MGLLYLYLYSFGDRDVFHLDADITSYERTLVLTIHLNCCHYVQPGGALNINAGLTFKIPSSKMRLPALRRYLPVFPVKALLAPLW